jgi:hypothetical protein
MKPWMFVVALAAVLAGVAFGIHTLLELRAETAPPTPEAFVQATWTVYRYAPGHQTHVGQLSLDCTACHRASADGALGRPGPAPCLSCHEDRSDIRHAMISIDANGERVPDGPPESRVTDCMRCHSFGPESDIEPDACMRCHSRSHEDTPRVTLHAEEACTKCHDVHENRVESMSCTSCHPTALSHQGSEESSPEQCLDCHDAHGPAQVAIERCAECHGEKGEKPIPKTATEVGHECIGCHKPHAFDKAQVADCRSCHEEQHVLAGAGHAECTSCHAPHDARGSVEGNVCVKCHADVALVHGAEGKVKDSCASCHVPHPERPVRGAPTCEGCHADVGKQGKHAHQNAMACTSCHTPHRFVGGEEMRGTCVGCHAKQLALIAKNPGHDACASCHTGLPHGVDLPPVACKSCHRDQGQVATAGHATCTNCHEPHTGEQQGRRCESCHSEQAAALLHPSKKLACTSCHDQHAGKAEPDIADCSSCHKKTDLPGLHGVREHNASCASCHAPHADSDPGERALCLSCHTEQRDHQPTATRCNGCHTFRASGARRRP